MPLTERQGALLEFVKDKHKGQTRKYTGEDFYHHPLRVAETMIRLGIDLVEAALCHDLFEDTDCSELELFNHLQLIGYTANESQKIYEITCELTNMYSHQNFPEMNRRFRSIKQASVEAKASKEAHTVRYADIMDNVPSIVRYDPQFAKVYLKEKVFLLDHIRKGDIKAFIECAHTLKEAQEDLVKLSAFEKHEHLIN